MQSVTTPADGAVELTLPFDLRQKSRLRTKLESGEDVALLLPRERCYEAATVCRLMTDAWCA